MASQRPDPRDHRQTHPQNLRQSSFVFTSSSDGRISEGVSLPSSAQKTPLCKPPQLQRNLPQTDQKYRRVSSYSSTSSSSSSLSSPSGQSSLRTHANFKIRTEHPFYSPGRRSSVARLNFTQENVFPSTPVSQTKCPIPLSSKKIKQRAALKLKEMESERIQASRYEQDQSKISLEVQEKAYLAWLNHVIFEPMQMKSRGTNDTLSGMIRANKNAQTLQVRNHGTMNAVRESITVKNCGIDDTVLHYSEVKKPGMFDILSEQMEMKQMNDIDLGACSIFNYSRSSRISPLATDRSKAMHLFSNSGKSMVPDSPLSRKFPIRNASSKPKSMKENLPADSSLLPICSIPVLRSRLSPLLDAKSREDVICTMIHLAKHIDEGRLKMKDGYTMLTDVALKEKFIQAMLSYNTPWLKMGLHIVLGHGAFLEPEMEYSNQQDGEEERETQNTILRWVIEKHFLAHPGLAKHHATNKKIEGLYKQGYNEALARVVLKRLLLFVLALDKAKSESTLPLACGIDGIDGGSPRLFHINRNIKSSRQALQEFLLSSMHGEGDIVGHLGVLQYHVTHVQAGLADYDFMLSNLIEDLRDGVRLCRLVQILLCDTSILMKVKLPSDRPRRHIHNCKVALERLEGVGVPLVDSFGCSITPEDVVGGYHEKVLSLLWNVMLHLQMPMLVNHARLREEITRIQPCVLAPKEQESSSLISLLLLWTQVISLRSGFPVKDFTSSFADGQALCYLINYYYPALLPQAAIKAPRSSMVHQNTPESLLIESKTICTLTLENNICAAQNLNLFNVAIEKLGHIPWVLQSMYFVDENPCVCEQSIIITLAFLYHRMLEDKAKLRDEKTHDLRWNMSFEIPKIKCGVLTDSRLKDSEEERKGIPAAKIQSSFKAILEADEELKGIATANIQGCKLQQTAVLRREIDAVVLIQSHVKRWIKRKSFTQEESSQDKEIRSATLIQAFTRGWLMRRKLGLMTQQVSRIQSFWRAKYTRQMFLNQRKSCLIIQNQWRTFSIIKMRQSQLFSATTTIQAWWRMIVLRKSFLELRKSSILIQRFFRTSQQRRRYLKFRESVVLVQALTRGRYVRKSYLKYRNAAQIIQKCWRNTVAVRKQKDDTVTRIQCIWRGFSAKRSFLMKREAAIVIQKYIRGHLAMKRYCSDRKNVVKIQAMVRCRYEHKKYNKILRSLKMIQRCWRRVLARRSAERKYALLKQQAALRIQAFWRGWEARVSFSKLQRSTLYLQTCLRCFMCRMRYKHLRDSAVRLQKFWRGWLARKYYLKLRASSVDIQRSWRSYYCRTQYSRLRGAVIRFQALFKGKQARQTYCELRKYAVKIQALFRCKKERRKFVLYKESALVIQRCVRDYIFQSKLLSFRKNLAAKKIQSVWRNRMSRMAATVIQAYCRGWIQRKYYATHILKMTVSPHILIANAVQSHPGSCKLACSQEPSSQIDAATKIQRHFRGWQARKIRNKRKTNIIAIQALWRGILVRQRSDGLRDKLSALRQRMQNTAANVDQKMRLEHRITEALAALLSQKTVSGILHTCATIDLATQHSKLCCERLLEAGAIPKLLQLIQTTNRSPPHEEILKHSLSILGNLARYPEFAALIANTPSSILVMAEQILRNNEEIQSKVIKLLLLICKVPCGLEAVRKKPVVVKRLYNLSQMLEKKVEVEARALQRLPQGAPPYVRRAGEKKVTEAVAHHHSIVLLLQSATGEDLHNKLKAMKRLSHIHTVPGPRMSMSMAPRLSMSTTPRLSMCRDPLQDCSNH